LYFLNGVLPWQNLAYSSNDLYKNIREKKLETSVENLCKGCPSEFFTLSPIVGISDLMKNQIMATLRSYSRI